MLTYPDRQRFEQIRARWETAQPSEEKQAEMGGWRDKPTAQQATSVEAHENGARKFRRKLSHGFSFISNPLSQRKITPGRSQLEAPPQTVTAPSAADVTTATVACDAPALPVHKSTSLISFKDTVTGPADQPDTDKSSKNADADFTPKPLPRSRTLSFIPLAAKTEPNTFTADIDGATPLDSLAVMSPPEPESVPTKIPSPSPPLYELRCSSPRRYLHHNTSYHTSQQMRYVAAAHATTGANIDSPAKSPQPLRSRPASNVVKGPNELQNAGFMAPRQPGPRRPVGSQRLEKPVLQENIPIDQRIANRRSQTQERTVKRESLAVAGTLYDRRSFGASTPVMQGRKTSFATPPMASKRMSSHVSQNTPVIVKRIQRDEQAVSQTPNRPTMRNGPVTKSLLLDRSRTSILRGTESSKQSLLRSYTQAELPRKTPSTPSGLGGVWRPSPALTAANHQVSKLPRSQTFHTFGAQPEDAPPVPPLPPKYRKSSLSDLTRELRMSQDIPTKPRHSRMASDVTSCQSIMEESAEEMASHDQTSIAADAEEAPSPSEEPTPATFNPMVSTIPSDQPQHPTLRTDLASSETTRPSQETRSESPGDVREQMKPDNADVAVHQVQDYMPPQYWAGRFQCRFDQWRTDAMNAELNIQSDRQVSSPLSEYKLDQENLAACQIFKQLHELCATDTAEDSLWEFELKYRKDHKLVGNPADFLPRRVPRKEENPASEEVETGALGRAIRKLTPRKSSLVNLMKGKVWNKPDEVKQNEDEEEKQKASSENL